VGYVRTRLSICMKKVRYSSEHEAAAVARGASLELRVYRCDRCRKFHLTSRTRGKRIPRPNTPSRDIMEATSTQVPASDAPAML